MKNFTMKDEEFICEQCNRLVSKLNYTARDHCPYCLYSKHVDINPGDRQNTCLGLLKPIDIEILEKQYKNLIYAIFMFAKFNGVGDMSNYGFGQILIK